MARRQIVEIDETKCDGCGQCVPACAEGAIRLVDGKAKLVADVYCDGLGACLGECPRGAITIVEREANPFDQAAVAQAKRPVVAGCPGAAMHDLRLNVLPAARQPSPGAASDTETPALSHWPIQLHLVPPNAPFLRNADLFLVADCVPFACADFHRQVLHRRPVVIGCPKLDNARAYVDKLAEMFVQSAVQSLTVVHMEVPCCTNLMRIAGEAMRVAGVDISLTEITIAINGEIRHS
jgi:Pyruvate/2-oxoacid:ferredoxin oxidoreductase delta subunit